MFEKDIPVPTTRPRSYPFAGLSAGESVLYKCDQSDKSKARKAAYRLATYHKWKIVVRSLKEGVRVWRLE